jgi:hypothetical protein
MVGIVTKNSHHHGTVQNPTYYASFVMFVAMSKYPAGFLDYFERKLHPPHTIIDRWVAGWSKHL